MERKPEAQERYESRKPFEEPKLTYLTPTLTERGNVQDVTLQGFFGSFSP